MPFVPDVMEPPTSCLILDAMWYGLTPDFFAAVIIIDEYVDDEPLGLELCINVPDNIASTPDLV